MGGHREHSTETQNCVSRQSSISDDQANLSTGDRTASTVKASAVRDIHDTYLTSRSPLPSRQKQALYKLDWQPAMYSTSLWTLLLFLGGVGQATVVLGGSRWGSHYVGYTGAMFQHLPVKLNASKPLHNGRTCCSSHGASSFAGTRTLDTHRWYVFPEQKPSLIKSFDSRFLSARLKCSVV